MAAAVAHRFSEGTGVTAFGDASGEHETVGVLIKAEG